MLLYDCHVFLPGDPDIAKNLMFGHGVKNEVALGRSESDYHLPMAADPTTAAGDVCGVVLSFARYQVRFKPEGAREVAGIYGLSLAWRPGTRVEKNRLCYAPGGLPALPALPFLPLSVRL
jgi:hypothetical protein